MKTSRPIGMILTVALWGAEMEPDAPLRVRVLGPQGQPVAGARGATREPAAEPDSPRARSGGTARRPPPRLRPRPLKEAR
jgi:hypothetical protein